MAAKNDHSEYENTGRDDRYLIDNDDEGADPFGAPPPVSSGSEWVKQAREAEPEPIAALPPTPPRKGAGISGASTEPENVAVGDAVYEDAAKSDDPLAAMYVKKTKLGDVGTGKLTIEEGLSGVVPDPKPPRGRMIVAGIAAAALLAGVAAAFAAKRTYVDENLRDVEMSLPRWAVLRMSMDKETAARQKLTEDDRAYLVTRSRLLDLYPAVFDYYRAHAEFPGRVADLAKAGLIDDRLAKDGWQTAFRIETTKGGDPAVASAGGDRRFGTADDVRYAGGGMGVPAAYEDADAVSFVEE